MDPPENSMRHMRPGMGITEIWKGFKYQGKIWRDIVRKKNSKNLKRASINKLNLISSDFCSVHEKMEVCFILIVFSCFF